MEKAVISIKGQSRPWFIVFVSLSVFISLFVLNYSAIPDRNNGLTFFVSNFTVDITGYKSVFFVSNNVPKDEPKREEPCVEDKAAIAKPPNTDSCSGRYIYVHHLPTKFNYDLLSDCHSLNKWFSMCPSLENEGLGPAVGKSRGVLTNKDWYATNQFTLEVIFHNRIKKYKCLTDDSSLASAIYVPFYAGLDIGRHLWGFNTSVRDSFALDLVKWLRDKPEWKRLWGRDHFFVGGRIAWDFRRQGDNESDWGSKLMSLQESKNMTLLSIEGSCWNNDFAIPYPTYFHPASAGQVYQWQGRVRRKKRPYLFSFVGAPRPGLEGSIRGQLIEQCQASGSCKLLNCNSGGNCDDPVEVMQTFQESDFCLQPPGDSYTRRSSFDSILAGCIPVFFHPASAYLQYTWHLPRNYTTYSVFISERDVRERKVKVNDVLNRYSKEDIRAMREEVINLIPRIIYAKTGFQSKNFEDAFDVTVKAVLKRVEKIRREMKDEKDGGLDLKEDGQWKAKLSEAGFGNEWDSFLQNRK